MSVTPLSGNDSKDRNVPWLQSDCHIGRPGDVLSRACLLALTLRNILFDKSEMKTSRRLFPLPWKCERSRIPVYTIGCDARTRDKAREIFDATRFVRIPTKSLTLRIVTRVIWLRCDSRSHGYTTRGACLGSASVSGRQLNASLMNKRLVPPYPPSSRSSISI